MYSYVSSVELSATDETCALNFINNNEDYLDRAILRFPYNFKRDGNSYTNKFEPHTLHYTSMGYQSTLFPKSPNDNSPTRIKNIVKSYVKSSQQTDSTETDDVYKAYKNSYQKTGETRVPIIYSLGQGQFDPNEFRKKIGSNEPKKLGDLPAYEFSLPADDPDPSVIVVAVDARPGQKINKLIELVAKYHCGEVKTG